MLSIEPYRARLRDTDLERKTEHGVKRTVKKICGA
jgi:hypothetical protein